MATGNAVVLKPASDTPASAFLIAEWFDKAGFPKGLVNVIAGRGSEIGDDFVSHPVPSLLSFTGSTDVGRRIGEIASGLLKDMSLELGGNNVMLVLRDADVERAANAAAFGAFFHQGQVCMALNRVIVDSGIHDAFVEAFLAVTKRLKVGDPADPETFIGPLISRTQVKSVEGLIRGTEAAGATVALRGVTEGNVISPWVFTDVANDMPAAANEVYGPVCCILRARNEDEAVALANDTRYGLNGNRHGPRQRSVHQRRAARHVRRRKSLRSGPVQRAVGGGEVHRRTLGQRPDRIPLLIAPRTARSTP